MEERRQEQKRLELLKFEGEDRICLDDVVKAVARLLGEEDLEYIKRLVIAALERNDTIEYITSMIIDIKFEEILNALKYKNE